MNYIAWDTETTGLPMTRQSASYDNVHLYDKCRMVTLAFVKYSSRGRELGSYHGVVYPDTFDVPPESTAIHGVTHEYAQHKGVPFGQVYSKFKDAVSNVSIMIAHNSTFDENCFFSECYRRGFSIEPFKHLHFVDTLKLARSVLPGLYNHKLLTIYKYYFGKEFDAHDALNDSRACGKIYPLLRDGEFITKDIGVEDIIIKASDVATIIGMNPYKKPKEIIDNLWSKYLPDTFQGKTKEQEALETINKCSAAKLLFKDAETYKSLNSSDIERKFNAVSNQLHLKSNLSDKEIKTVEEHVRKTLFTNHGIRHEETTASNYDNLKEDKTFYKYEICSIEGTTYSICGRIDRIRDDKTIIEIKNRARGLFNSVKTYEEIQCQVYMEMLNLDNCELIEQYNDTRKTYLIQRDQMKWKSEILPVLKNFCTYFHSEISK
jgi:DNA polymerase III epsilon subunit-like protein